jgi:hypothetical protein
VTPVRGAGTQTGNAGAFTSPVSVQLGSEFVSALRNGRRREKDLTKSRRDERLQKISTALIALLNGIEHVFILAADRIEHQRT